MRRGSGRSAGEPASVSEAFVTNQTDDLLSIVELGDLKVAETLKIGGKPAGIAMSADGKLAFLTSPEGKEVVVVDAVARKIVRRIKIGEGPLGIAAHPSNGRIYVADWYTHKLSVIDPIGGNDGRRGGGRRFPVGRRRHAGRPARAHRRPRQQLGLVHRR